MHAGLPAARVAGGQGIHNAFDAVASRIPDHVAVRSRSGDISYAELRTMSDAGAVFLAARGVRPGDRVAVMTERTPTALAALLAILKTGAGYVPVDPKLPERRLDDIFRATLLAAVIGSPPPGATPAGAVSIGFEAFAHAALQPERPGRLGDDPSHVGSSHLGNPRDVAYVVTTSGTTGAPKPIVTTHANLTWSLTRLAERIGLGDQDVFLARTSLTFDPHAVELLLPLLLGASIGWATPEESRDPSAITRLVHSYRATVVQGTPSFWQLMTATDWSPSGPLTVLCGGEALSSTLQRKLLRTPGVSLWNVYGPTETTVWAGALRMKAESPPRIGGPLDGAAWVVRDSDGTRVKDSAVGELWIGGPGVSPGYLDRPELTANAFRPVDPDVDGQRSYRTGDLVRRRDDGVFDYIGRVDRQRKLRGHRIELTEVEAVLSGCPGVDSVAVLVTSEDRLRAAVATTERDLQSLRARLRSTALTHLPESMVPTEYVFADTMPLGPTEKLDEGALLAVAAFRPDAEPLLDRADPVVRSVAAALSGVLGGAPVTHDLRLVDVGVDSMSLVWLQLGLREVFGWALDLATLREASSVSGIADAYRTLDRRHRQTALPASPGDGAAGNSPRTVPLTPAQRRVLVDANGQVRDTNVLQLLVTTDRSPETAMTAARRLLTDADVFHVRALDWKGDIPSQTFGPGPVSGIETWPVIGIRPDQAPQSAAMVVEALKEAGGRLRPEKGQLYLCIVGTIEHRTFVYVAMHHVIADGVSLAVVKALLGSYLATPGALPASTPFATWARAAQDRNCVDAVTAERWQHLLRPRGPLATRISTASTAAGVQSSAADPIGTAAVTPVLRSRQRMLTDMALPGSSREVHTLLLATSAHQLGVQLNLDEVTCRVVESGRGLHGDLEDGLTIGMLSHHYPVLVSIGISPGHTLAMLRDELGRTDDRGSSYEWVRADPTWGHTVPALSELPLYVNYLPGLPSPGLVDESWQLDDGAEVRQAIPGIALLIRPDGSGLQVTAHYNEETWSRDAIDAFLGGLAASVTELTKESAG